MNHTTDLKDWITPDLSLPEEPASEPTKRCIGCGAEVIDGETPPCGH
ncbi:hypothetical protein QTN24_15775 [Cupriavidus sp. SZY C1]|nr:hypothetical protein [Cupriavidus sp. SZY C1]MDT6962957.1 hypothetical protein [Cupriavidus sp. SZY C1]